MIECGGDVCDAAAWSRLLGESGYGTNNIYKDERQVSMHTSFLGPERNPWLDSAHGSYGLTSASFT